MDEKIFEAGEDGIAFCLLEMVEDQRGLSVRQGREELSHSLRTQAHEDLARGIGRQLLHHPGRGARRQPLEEMGGLVDVERPSRQPCLELGQRPGCTLQLRKRFAQRLQQSFVKRLLSGQGALPGAQDLVLEGLELRRHVAFGALECLPADVVGGRAFCVSAAELDVVAVNPVVAHLEGVDPGSLTFALLQFIEKGVGVIALSTDSEERAARAKTDWGLPRLRVGYGFSLSAAREWGLFLSAGRGTTSIGVEEPALFAEPGTTEQRLEEIRRLNGFTSDGPAQNLITFLTQATQGRGFTGPLE